MAPRLLRIVGAVLAVLLLAACAGAEMRSGEKSHARRDTPPGPGILSGQDGEFVLYRLEKSEEGEGTSNDATQ